MFFSIVATPIGDFALVGDGESIREAFFADCGPTPQGSRDDAAFKAAREQVQAYFAGELRAFELPIDPHGTDFQRNVWSAVRDIGYGQTSTYGAVARKLGKPRAFRAVGAANGSNPVSILIPCHRLVGADGSLTGYGGGMHRKQWLLELEAER